MVASILAISINAFVMKMSYFVAFHSHWWLILIDYFACFISYRFSVSFQGSKIFWETRLSMKPSTATTLRFWTSSSSHPPPPWLIAWTTVTRTQMTILSAFLWKWATSRTSTVSRLLPKRAMFMLSRPFSGSDPAWLRSRKRTGSRLSTWHVSTVGSCYSQTRLGDLVHLIVF